MRPWTRSEMAGSASRDVFKSAVLDAAKAAGVAAALAFPLLGFRLTDSVQGAGIESRLLLVVYSALAVFLGRFVLNYIKNICHGPRTRVTQAIIGLFRRVDTRLLGGPVKPGHDKWGSVLEPLLLAAMAVFAI